MTLDAFRPLADRVTEPLVTGAKRVGLTPNVVSLLAFVLAIGAGISFVGAGDASMLYLVGASLVLGNGVLDLIDGGLARELNTASRAGDLLDHVLDRYADIIIIAGLAAGIDQFALGIAAITGVLMTSYLGTQAQAVDLDRVYGGVLGRADRLVLTSLVTIAAAFLEVTALELGVVGWLLVVFAVVGHLTALQRFYYAMRELS